MRPVPYSDTRRVGRGFVGLMEEGPSCEIHRCIVDAIVEKGDLTLNNDVLFWFWFVSTKSHATLSFFGGY